MEKSKILELCKELDNSGNCFKAKEGVRILKESGDVYEVLNTKLENDTSFDEVAFNESDFLNYLKNNKVTREEFSNLTNSIWNMYFMGEDDPDNAYYSYLFHTGIDINESYSSPSSDYAFAITGNRNTDMDDYFDEWLKLRAINSCGGHNLTKIFTFMQKMLKYENFDSVMSKLSIETPKELLEYIENGKVAKAIKFMVENPDVKIGYDAKLATEKIFNKLKDSILVDNSNYEVAVIDSDDYFDTLENYLENNLGIEEEYNGMYDREKSGPFMFHYSFKTTSFFELEKIIIEILNGKDIETALKETTIGQFFYDSDVPSEEFSYLPFSFAEIDVFLDALNADLAEINFCLTYNENNNNDDDYDDDDYDDEDEE